MIESIDWPSFGYGAGVFSLATMFWSYRSDMVTFVRKHAGLWQLRAERRRAGKTATIQAMLKLAAQLHEQEARLRERERQLEGMQLPIDAREKEREAFQMEIDRLGAALRKATIQDQGWENYRRRKKGLPVEEIHTATGQVVVSPGVRGPDGVPGLVTVWDGVMCVCGHGSRQHAIVEPEACRRCGCRGFQA